MTIRYIWQVLKLGEQLKHQIDQASGLPAVYLLKNEP